MRGDRVRETSPTYAYEDEDQSTGLALKLGMEVRHPQFGIHERGWSLISPVL